MPLLKLAPQNSFRDYIVPDFLNPDFFDPGGNGNYNVGKTLRHQHLKWTLDFDFEDENGNMDEGKDNDDYDDLDSNPQSR